MWILLGLIYALSNAFYTTYNDKRKYDGYILGIWRGFGISLCFSPLLLTVTTPITLPYVALLIIQGILIGIYDSHIFFASARYGGTNGAGFMATSVLITVFLWWTIEIEDFKALIKNPPFFITLMLILSAYSASYWQMMHTNLTKKAEKYLYPAVFALALMSIVTRYIALHGGSMYEGVIWYLSVACFVSGVYNTIMLFATKTKHINRYPHAKESLWLLAFSTVLIIAKTTALRLAPNPGYVVALLLLSPIITQIIRTQKIKPTPYMVLTLILLILLLRLIS